MRQKNTFFLLLLLVVLIIAFVLALGYHPRARLFPLVVITACGILVLTELLKAMAAALKRTAPGEEGEEEGETREATKQHRRKFFSVLAWLAGFTFVLWLLGFVIALPLFVFAYVKSYEKGWLWALVLAAAMFVVVYAGFGILLETPLYEGWLFLP